MIFRTARESFRLMESGARTAIPRRTHRLTLGIDCMEDRASLSGLGVNPGVLVGFNPQPDPPARSALIGPLDAATNRSHAGTAPLLTAPLALASTLRFEVPPGPC
jgi:hypothetical protein